MNSDIFQFKITLLNIRPPIWRQIQVPAKYSFWDLHVAIQDAMGWLDYHLHSFQFSPPNKKSGVIIGIPDDEFEDEMTLPGWEIKIANNFTKPGKRAIYEYDFGDTWQHKIILEAILPKEKDVKYPRCIAGERACPPEDCGGVAGYRHLLGVLRNPKHKDYQDTIAWLKGHAKNYHPFQPEVFNPAKVHFSNPKARWKMAFPEG